MTLVESGDRRWFSEMSRPLRTFLLDTTDPAGRRTELAGSLVMGHGQLQGKRDSD